MKLIEALNAVNAAADGRPPHPISLLTGFTGNPLDVFLAAHLQPRLADRHVQVQIGRFGDLSGNLRRYLDQPSSAAALVIEWPDLDPRLGWREQGGWGRAQAADICATVERQLGMLEQLLASASAAGVFAIALPSLPTPPVEPIPVAMYGGLQTHLDLLIASFAARLSSHRHLRWVNPSQLAALSPANERLDVRAMYQTGFPYRMSHADALASLLAQLIQPPSPLKGIITDLDETLWTGIVGEVGPESVTWDLEHHSAHHGVYQQMLQSLADSGVLVAIASKNDPKVVESAMARRDILLRSQSVWPIEVHWAPKSESVGRILKAWNIAADSVVFIDDSPLELAEVRNAHPTIHTRLFEQDANKVATLLFELTDLFGKPFDSKEDSLRLNSLRSEAQLRTEIDGTGSLETVLADANGVLTITPVTIPPDPRALELINKTNQFNLNGIRLSDSDWMQLLKDPQHVAWVGSYEDKFGALGKISVLSGRKTSDGEMELDTWVLSCRAFARRIEYAMLGSLFDQYSLQRIKFRFRATDRNGPIQELLGHLTGAAPSEDPAVSSGDFSERKLPWYMRVQSPS